MKMNRRAPRPRSVCLVTGQFPRQETADKAGPESKVAGLFYVKYRLKQLVDQLSL